MDWKEKSADRPPEAVVAGQGKTVRSLWAQWDRVELVDGLLYRRWEEESAACPIRKQLILPQSFVPEVLRTLHSGVGGSHLGIRKTVQKIRQRFYWPQLRRDVEDWCHRCEVCARSKMPNRTVRGPLSPSQVGFPMERVALDIFGPLPQSRSGNKYVLIITDYFTRWVEALPLPNQEALTIAKALVDNWVCRFGAPISIHSDQGRNFESSIFTELCHLLGIHKTRTTPYHPQSDGLVERFNRTLRMLLTAQMAQVPEDTWDDHIPLLMLAYRSSVQESTQFTPAQLMFGREVQLPVDLVFGGGPAPGVSHSEYIGQLHSRLDEAYDIVRRNMQSVQKHEKQLYDRKVTGGRYSVGDQVWLYTPAIPRGRSAKFHQFWSGPYQVMKVLSDVTYRIQSVYLPGSQNRRRHRVVVHYNRLKPCHGHQNLVPPPAPQTTESPPASQDVTEDFIVPLPTVDPLSGDSQQTDTDQEDVPETEAEPTPREPPRGGHIWGPRLRQHIRRPDYYQPESGCSSRGGNSVVNNE